MYQNVDTSLIINDQYLLVQYVVMARIHVAHMTLQRTNQNVSYTTPEMNKKRCCTV